MNFPLTRNNFLNVMTAFNHRDCVVKTQRHTKKEMFSFPGIYFIKIIYIICVICALNSCGPDKPKQPQAKKHPTKAQIDSMMAEAEKAYNKMEEDRINNYISTHHTMEKNPAGFWYWITKENKTGRKIEDGSMVRYSRVISLADGTPCYSDINILKVGNGSEITGMHDALKTLRQGEKAIFIFPSYLAHGLLGDAYKIPPKSELVYEVEILDVK